MCIQTKEMLTSELGIEVQSLICEGDTPTVIVDIAREKKADLIVLGTYGRKGLKKLLMGSVTSQVIVNSPVDVLVVKKPCAECAGEYKSILVPFDGSVSSQKAINRACQLSSIDNADVTALYIIPRYEEMVEFFRSESIKKSLLQEAQKITDSAKRIASKNRISIKVEILEGQPAEQIIETATNLKNDLIVMGSYGWRGETKPNIGR